MRGHGAAVAALLAAGADAGAETADGRCAFEWAAAGCHVAAMLALGRAIDADAAAADPAAAAAAGDAFPPPGAPPPRPRRPPPPLAGAATVYARDGSVLERTSGWAERRPAGYAEDVLRQLDRFEWEGRSPE
jgi:hypothetical protein